MRSFLLSTLAFLVLTSVGCNTPDRSQPETSDRYRTDSDSAARKAGRAAYEIKQETKAAAKKAAKELKRAGEQAREGWNDAKRDAQEKGSR